jgi:hypothetical protein
MQAALPKANKRLSMETRILYGCGSREIADYLKKDPAFGLELSVEG